MDPTPYRPRPLDTSHVELPAGLLALLETLAEHAHDEWAAARLREGWRYGPERSEAKKEHPCLVPYAELPEHEKDYDRRSAAGTLKAITLLGFDLVPCQARMHADLRDRLREGFLAELQQPAAGTVAAIWSQCATWSSQEIGADLLHTLLRKALGNGELWLCGEMLDRCQPPYRKAGEALDAEEQAEDDFRSRLAGEPRFQHLTARFLTQTGAWHEARLILARLKAAGAHDGETLGLLARTYKDAWYHAVASQATASAISAALAACREACREAADANPGDSYPGINAATLALLSGDAADARYRATRVQSICQQQIDQTGPDAWNLATLAEAQAVLGQRDAAARLYQEGARQPGASLRDVCTTRKQARLIATHQGWGAQFFDDCFGLPPVIVFAGHRLDQPDRPTPRFPPAHEPAIAAAIHQRLQTLRQQVQPRFPLIAYGSAASGADLLFAEALAALPPGEIHLVLPGPREDFIQANAAYAGPDWERRCRAALERAYEVLEASRHQPVSESLSFQYAQEVMAGLACMKADHLGLDLLPMAVWDDQPGDGHGGTADFVQLWQQRGLAVEPIPHSLPVATRPNLSARRRGPLRFGGQDQHLKAMLFADVRHFSRLSEAQLPLFVEQFMGAASVVIAGSRHRPVVLNTWGDAFYMVFDAIEDAALMALELRSALCPAPQGRAVWQQHGLPAELSIRFAVHAGPVFAIADPVVRHPSFTGRHTTQTARLEPVTRPGEVFATQEFAALAHLQGLRSFTCRYLGRADLDKGYRKNEAIYQILPAPPVPS